MANDVVGFLNALDIRAAHLVGASMGGMIAQLVASRFPFRTLSLTSIMSTSGAHGLPGPSSAMVRHMMAPYRKDRASIIRRAAKTVRLANGGSTFTQCQPDIIARVTASYDRSHYPAGARRHMVAISASGSRVHELRKIKSPSLVIHGALDPMLPVAAAYSTAEHIPGAKLSIIQDMGHDLPPGLSKTIGDLIIDHVCGCTKAVAA